MRNERNKARDEAKQLRTSLEAAIKESNSYKREKNELELQINQLKKEMEKVHHLMMKHAGQFNGNGNAEEHERDGRDNSNCSPDISSDGLKNVNSEDGLMINAATLQDQNDKRDGEEYVSQGAVPKHIVESLRTEGVTTFNRSRFLSSSSFIFLIAFILFNRFQKIDGIVPKNGVSFSNCQKMNSMKNV